MAKLAKGKSAKADGSARMLPRQGFTLIEMLTVLVLIGILMAAIGLSVRKAKHIARNTKAEAECRELMNALLEYRSLYGNWPGESVHSGRVKAGYSFLSPLFDATQNRSGIVFLNLNLAEGTDWLDPWGLPYMVEFPDGRQTDPRRTVLESCVSFPFRRESRFPPE